MAAVLIVTAVVVAFVTLLMFAVLVEFQRQITQLRRFIGLEDDARPVPFDMDVVPATLEIPALSDDVSAEGRAAVLLLSDHCSACLEIAAGLPPSLPKGLVLLVEATSAADAAAWLADHGLTFGPTVVYDSDGSRAAALGVRGTPAVVKFEGGKAVNASNVPTVRQLYALIGWLEGRPVEDPLLR